MAGDPDHLQIIAIASGIIAAISAGLGVYIRITTGTISHQLLLQQQAFNLLLQSDHVHRPEFERVRDHYADRQEFEALRNKVETNVARISVLEAIARKDGHIELVGPPPG